MFKFIKTLASIFDRRQIKSYSQASQDQFVCLLLYQLLNKQDDGYYFEIGAGHPSVDSNTCFFEKKHGWKGTSIDIAEGYRNIWLSTRENPLLVQDATESDYQAILKHYPHVIDYLSLDIDCSYTTLLQRIPFNDYVFKIITIEHDFYRFGNEFREEERKILMALGYHLLCPDVSVFFNGMDCVFEDWWVHPSIFSDDMFSILKSLDLKAKKHEQLINTIKSFSREFAVKPI